MSDPLMKYSKTFEQHDGLTLEELIYERSVCEKNFIELEEEIEKVEFDLLFKRNELLAYLAIDRDLAVRIGKIEALEDIELTMTSFAEMTNPKAPTQ